MKLTWTHAILIVVALTAYKFWNDEPGGDGGGGPTYEEMMYDRQGDEERIWG